MEENNLGNKDVQFSIQELHTNTKIGEIPSCGSIIDSIFDDLLRDNDTHECTHFHTCNPPGPDLPHTHTCVHVHTKKPVPSSIDDGHNVDDSAESNEQHGRKGGNREAVRKYRHKRKAYTTSLANELVKLRASNQQLMQRLQSQVTLETEVARLKCLLVDIRGRIEGDIGSFPYQKPCSTLVDTNLLGSIKFS